MKPLYLFLIYNFFTSITQANDFLNKTNWKDNVPQKNIVIKNPYGEVRIRHSDTSNIVEYNAIFQQLHPQEQLKIEHNSNNNTFSIVVISNANQQLKTKSSKDNTSKESRVDILAYIPQDKKLLVQTDKGLIEAKGLKTNTKLESKSGQISVRKHTGHISTHNEIGETSLILEDQGIQDQKFSSVYGNISALINESSDFEISASTSGDIISDFSTQISKQRNKEPNKTAIISLNKAKSKVVFYSKRGELAIREYKKY